MNFFTKFIFSLITIIISVFVAISIIEISLRLIFYNDDWFETKKINVLRNFEYKYHLNNLYESEKNYVVYKRDNFGLRDNCENKNIDILTIGGSTTDQRYINIEDTFQNIIQQYYFNETNTKICVSNAGIDGHSTYGHIYSFEKWFPLIPNLNPKYIILYIGINDVDFSRIDSSNYGFDKKPTEGFEGLKKNLYLIELLKPIQYFIEKNQAPAYGGHNKFNNSFNDYIYLELGQKTPDLAEINKINFQSRLIKILKHIEDMGSVPICITQPHQYTKITNGKKFSVPFKIGNHISGIDYDYALQKINQAIHESCGEFVIDLYSQNFNKKDFYDGVHTTPKGSKKIGKLIFNYMKSNDLMNFNY